MIDDVEARCRRVYFDAQQWNYLVDPVTGLHPDGALRCVQRAVKAGDIKVVGSPDLIQELWEAAPRFPKKSRQMTDLFFKAVGRRLLLPLNERVWKEAATGGLLSDESRYVAHDVYREVRRLAQTGPDALEVAEDLFKEKAAFL